MMRTLFYRVVVTAFILSLNIPLCSAGEPPPEIKEAASEGIRVFLRNPRMTGLHRLGFASQSDVDTAVLGEGFQIFTVPPDRLLDESHPLNLQSLAIATNQWQFLVVAGTQANALLTVDLMDGQWKPVSIGSAGLAKEISSFLAAWPATSGYRYRLIRVYQAKSEFFEVSDGEQVIGIVPLGSLNAAMGDPNKVFDPADLREASEVLMKLRPPVRAGIQSGQ